jgi:carboxypeptidase family protein
MNSRMPPATSAWASFFALVLFVLLFVLLPNVTFAQSSITGTVRDTSGAVLPGVTVEASSAVLIEKVRTVPTDDGGLYRVLDLRPGIYTVTFTLPGFATVRREGIDLPSSSPQR